MSGADSSYFTIDPSSGLLRINASLDYEQGKFNYSFKVTITRYQMQFLLNLSSLFTYEKEKQSNVIAPIPCVLLPVSPLNVLL